MDTRNVTSSGTSGSDQFALVSAHADAAAQLAGRLAGRVDGAMVGRALAEGNEMLGGLKYLAAGASYATDTMAVGQSAVSRTVNAGARLGGDMIVDAAMEQAVGSGLMRGGAVGVGSAFTLADAFVGDGHAASVVTELGSSIDVATNVQHGVHAAFDSLYVASLAVRGDAQAMYAAADQMQDGTLNGRYGAVTQGYAAATAVMTGDREAIDTLTDASASTGERGTLVAWGNCAGDMIHQVVTSDYAEEGWTFVPDRN